MREIVVDTETTGLSFKNGDRVVEVGCVELINKSQIAHKKLPESQTGFLRTKKHLKKTISLF